MRRVQSPLRSEKTNPSSTKSDRAVSAIANRSKDIPCPSCAIDYLERLMGQLLISDLFGKVINDKIDHDFVCFLRVEREDISLRLTTLSLINEPSDEPVHLTP